MLHQMSAGPPASPGSISRLNTDQLKSQLRSLGAVKLNLLLPETRAIPYVMHPGEQLLGIVYGRYKQKDGRLVGRGALLATDDRVLLIDKKPMFLKCDEIIYEAISGVTYSNVWRAGTLTLHTKLGEIKLRTFNHKSAEVFVGAVESKVFAHKTSAR